MSGVEERAEGTWQEGKGKVKEAVGELTEDEHLEREGLMDQVKGKGKQALGKGKEALDKAKEAIADVKESVKERPDD